MKLLIPLLLLVHVVIVVTSASGGAEGVTTPRIPETIRPHLDAIEHAVARARRQADAESMALIEADLAFALDARLRTVGEAFGSRMLPDAKIISPGQPVVIGPEKIREAFADNQATWWWGPEEARVDGLLGVTWGIACIAVIPQAGEPAQILRTRYLTVWRKDPCGEWKIWLDIGNQGMGLEMPPQTGAQP